MLVIEDRINDRQVRTITDIVKTVWLVYPASPEPDHVLIAVFEKLKPSSISLGSNRCKKVVGGNPVGA
jgi:hypothetical protein